MNSSILAMEFNSVAGGIYISDLLVKEADVTLLVSRTTCPGKYMVILEGGVDALKSSLGRALQSGLAGTVTEKRLFPNIEPSVGSALSGVPDYARIRAVGAIETYGVAAAIMAADAGAKKGGVELVEIRLGDAQGGKCVVIFSGEQDMVEEAVAAGCSAAEEQLGLINSVIVERPHDCLPGFLER